MIAVIGTLNATIGTLNVVIGTLNTTIGTVNSAIGTLIVVIGTLNVVVGTLNTTIGTLNATIGTFHEPARDTRVRTAGLGESIPRELRMQQRLKVATGATHSAAVTAQCPVIVMGPSAARCS